MRAAVRAGLEAHQYETVDRDLPRALAAAERALALKRQVPGAPNISIEHATIARILLALGRPKEAAVQFRAARERATENESRYWRDLVGALLSAGDVQDARKEATALANAVRSKDDEARADAALANAAVAAASNEFDRAIEGLRVARALTANAPARQFEVIASLATLLLDATRALPYDTALALADRVSRDFPDLPIDLRPMARAAASLRRRLAGDLDGVIRETSEAVDAARASGRITAEIQATRELAAIYASLNAWPEATELLEDARRLIQRAVESDTPLPADVAMTTSTLLGHASNDLGDLDRARRAFDEAIAAFNAATGAATRRQLASAYGDAVLGLARVAFLDGKQSEAAAILSRALNGDPKEAVFDRADVLARLARVERTTDPAGAPTRFVEAIRAYEKAGDRASALTVRMQLIEFLAGGAANGSDVTLARSQIDEAGREIARLGHSDAQWRLYRAEGLIAEAAGENAAAASRYEASITALENLRARLSTGDDRTGLLDAEAAQDVYRRLASLCLAEGRTADAWRMVERSKARTFVETLAVPGSATVQASAGAELKRLETEIAGLRVLMSPGFESLQRGAGREPSALRGQLEDLERRYALERRRAASASARAAASLAVDPITLEDAGRRLPPRAALVEYAPTPDGLIAFIVTAKSFETVRWKVDWNDLRARVTALRERLSDLMAQGLQQAATDVAARAIPAELLAKIPADVDRLLLVPADVLLYVPFDVLPLPDQRMVIDRFTVSYLPSASALKYLAGSKSSGDGSLFLGALGESRVEDWAPLPGTLTETAAILKEYPSATRVVEQAFTQRAAIDALTRFDRVHFATHGILNGASPMFSGVLMGTPGGDTRLSLFQIAALPIRARLVVLSACETGLGRLQRGDEITGLTRTFLQAGASSVVSSLWSVADDSTAFLMARFYRELGRGEPPAVALRTAALAARAEYGHPFYWAPFTLTGVQ